MIKTFFTLGLFLLVAYASAQTLIQGTVKDTEQKKGIEGVNITIHEKDNPAAILGFTSTDKDGKYRIEYKGNKDSLIIAASGFNIQKQSKTVARKNQTVDFVVDFASITLQEVKITLPKISQKGDTLSYTVSSFMDNNDRTIGDVLKKLPGIEVKESGQILYQNIPINKFYIEGLDLLQGRYGIATKNIEAKDVLNVEVLENHQEIRLLKDKMISTQAAINLKLKESAKGVWTANALLGTGISPAHWAGELTAMYFAKNTQNISTYKGNNTGNDVSGEQGILYTMESFQQQDDRLLSLQAPSPPSISSKRYLFNDVNGLSFNNLWKTSKDYQINANIQYLNDRIDRSSFNRTVYYLLRDYMGVEETLESRSYINQANADIQLNINKDKFYLNNRLQLKSGWDNERGNALRGDTVRQQLDEPDYGINNTFELIKNYAKTALHITSYNSYSSSPQTLTVEPVLYENLFPASDGFQAMRQTSTINRFASNTSASGGYKKGNLNQDYAMSFRADMRHLDSDLAWTGNPSKQAAIPDSLNNNLQWNRFEWIFSPQYTYKYNEWQLRIELPLNYTLLSINEHSAQGKENNKRLFMNPSLEIRNKLSAYWDFTSSASYTHGFGGIDNEYTGYIMRNYRNLMRNEGDLYETQTQKYSLNFYYRNPFHSLLGNIGISYKNTKANLLYGYDFYGILQVQRSLVSPNYTEGITSQINISQAIDAIASTLKLGGSYTLASASQLAQGRILRSNRQQYTVVPEISTRISSWAGFSYRFLYIESHSKIKEQGALQPIRSSTQKVQLSIFPVKNLILNLGYEYFYNSAIVSGSRTMSFGDIGAKYKWNQIEFLLDYTNVFNSKRYVSASYSEISSNYYAYDLRPAEILLRVRFKLK
jgi:hypothetical protein